MPVSWSRQDGWQPHCTDSLVKRVGSATAMTEESFVDSRLTYFEQGVRMNIQLDSSPSADDLNVLSQGIKAFNREHLPDEVVFEEDTRFAVVARNERGGVVGGIRATAYWNYCFIELLWLSEEVRGTGVGSKLMERVEAYALERGFEYVRTETTNFQAKPFYKKLGYEVFGELTDHPKGHTTYCLVKALC